MIILSLSETVIHILMLSISFLCVAVGLFIFMLIFSITFRCVCRSYEKILKWFRTGK